MIERTKARLQEARSLLDQLLAERFVQVQHAKSPASPKFHQLLNDFVTRARTVRWVLQSEEKQKYDAWTSSPGAALTVQEQETFDLVATMRNSIEKQGHANTVARLERVEIPESDHPVHGTHYFGLPGSGRPTTIIDVYYVEGTDREVLSLCEQYLAILTTQVQDFEKYAQG
jgi:hypothetical protein